MPWRKASPMTERIRFVLDCEIGVYSITEPRHRYGVSRKTGHKCLRRFEQGGPQALADSLTRPHSCPDKTSHHCVDAILEKKGHPSWRAKKILSRLRKKHPDRRWPADSTRSAMLQRHGFVKSRRRSRKRGRAGRQPLCSADTAQRPPGRIQRRETTRRARPGDDGLCLPAGNRIVPGTRPPVEYPGHSEVRRISRNGGIRWNSNWVNVSRVLATEFVAFEDVDDDAWNVYFGPVWPGRFHEKKLKIEDALDRKQ